jgi:hypothetical protein
MLFVQFWNYGFLALRIPSEYRAIRKVEYDESFIQIDSDDDSDKYSDDYDYLSNPGEYMWTCSKCVFVNSSENSVCQVCETAKDSRPDARNDEGVIMIE